MRLENPSGLFSPTAFRVPRMRVSVASVVSRHHGVHHTGEKSSLKFEGKSSCLTRPLRIFAFFVVPEGNPTGAPVFRLTSLELLSESGHSAHPPG